MQKRSLFLAVVAGVFIWGLGALDARAGGVPLPTNLGQLTGANSGNWVTNGDKEFTDFTYGGPTPPAAAQVAVTAFNLPGPPAEIGISFQPSPAWNAGAGVSNDWVITYEVISHGGPITDAYLGITGGLSGGNGNIDVSETITTLNGTPIGQLDAFITASGKNLFADSVTLSQPAQAILVTKDIDVVGGTTSLSTLSVVNQAFSQVVPEPASLALLGIGMTGFLAFRRFFKRTSVA